MLVVPGLIPVTTPAVTVAIEALSVDHTPPPVALAIVMLMPEQVVWGPVMAATTGYGFTRTVTLKAVPTQDPEVGVTAYTTLIGARVVLVRVPKIVGSAEPDAVPVIPATTGADHV